MNLYRKISKQPYTFKQLTGITVIEFDLLHKETSTDMGEKPRS